MSSTTKVTARRDLIKYKYALRQRSKERDQRIEAAALDVLVQLGKRADAEQAAGHALELLHAEGLKTADIAEWCGGLTATEINRLRTVARTLDADADSPVGGADTDAARAPDTDGDTTLDTDAARAPDTDGDTTLDTDAACAARGNRL